MSFRLGSKRYRGPLVSSAPTKFGRPFGRGNLNPGPSILGFYGRHGYDPSSSVPQFTDTSKYAPKAKLGKRKGVASYGSRFKRPKARPPSASLSAATAATMPKFAPRRRAIRTAARGRFARRTKSPRFAGRRSARPFRSFRGRLRRRFKRRYSAVPRKSFARKVMMAVAPDRTFVQSFVDYVSLQQTNQSDAIQAMWAMNQVQSGETTPVGGRAVTTAELAAGTFANLSLWDPAMISQVFQQEFTGADAAKPTSQLYFNSYSASARITNGESTPIELIEYRCVMRRSQAGITDAPYAKLDALLRHSGDAEAFPTAISKLYFSRYGTTPFDLPRWCREVKILKVKNRNLAPGQSFELKYSAKRGRMFTLNDAFQQLGTGGDTQTLSDAMKGQTFSLFTMRGTFTGKTGNDPALKFGIGSATVGIIYRYKIHFRNLHPETRQTGIIQTLPAVSGGAAANPVMNIVTITGGGGDGAADIDQYN